MTTNDRRSATTRLARRRTGVTGATGVTTGAATLALAASLALGACTPASDDGSGAADGPDLKVSGAYVPEPVMDTMAGGFLTVRNTGNEADRLTSVSADFAAKGELHKTVNQQMEQVKSLPVPANGALELSRGGNHVMFLDLKRKPREGDKVSVTLRFAKSGPVQVTVPVKATNHQPEK